MQIDGALVREQGIEFGVIIVQKSALTPDSTARETQAVFQAQIADFAAVPLILASQDSRGRFEYWGRPDIVSFLASVDASRIPWRRYNVS